MPKSTKSDYCSRLKKLGYITYVSHGTWQLTEKGSDFLRGCETEIELCKQIFHYHDYQIKVPILKNSSEIPKNWNIRKKTELHNWNSYCFQMNTKLGILDIEKTTKSFIITLPRIFVKDDDIATRIKNNIMLQVIGFLKESFKGIKLEVYDKSTKDFFIINHRINRQVGLPNDPLAQLCLNLGIKELRSKRLVMDNSPKNLKRLRHVYDADINGEIEGVDKNLSVEDIGKVWDHYHDIINDEAGKIRINQLEHYTLQNAKLINHFAIHMKSHVAAIQELTKMATEIRSYFKTRKIN